jgi:putative iron-regulated protein
MKNLNKLIACLCLMAIVAVGCKKDDETTSTDTSTVQGEVLGNFVTNIAVPNLTDLSVKAAALNVSIKAFVATPSQAGILEMQQKWYATRVSWEQSEAFLFGPVATKDLDPAIDSWPVNFVDIDTVVNNTTNVFTEAFIDSLDPTLKGFHPIEYLIFGTNGTRTYTELNARQIQYLAALGNQLQRVTAQMIHEWKVDGENYGGQIMGAGNKGSQFASQKEALLEITNAMIGIIDEVGSGKIEEPFVSKNPSLEESPFAKNSWTDFKNNIKGSQNVYMGKFLVQGKGLSNFVQLYNKSLDVKIQQKLESCILNIGSYTTPFGESILNQPAAVQSTQTQLADLKDLLEKELIPLIQLNAK